MARVTIISAAENRVGDLRTRLGTHFDTEGFDPSRLPDEAPGEFVLVDIDLRDKKQVSNLSGWLQRRSSDAEIAFCVDPGSAADKIQAYSLGATCILNRPVDSGSIANKLLFGEGSLCDRSTETDRVFDEVISAGVGALGHAFGAAISGEAPDAQRIEAASSEVADRITKDGLAPWLEMVRKYHNQTFQHCLIVTSVAVAFGQQLGFGIEDQRRLAQAGLIHDIGKALIPVDILEKPGALDARETAVMRTHPRLGYEILVDSPGFGPEMLDVVLHHHEYIDGSGYPDGLKGDELSGLVRTITIADIFGALVEQRPYKPPMPGRDAYRILLSMGPKLDMRLVRAFAPLAETVI